LAAANRHSRLWVPPVDPLIGGCFVAFAQGEAGPGHPGDRAWAAAVAWRPPPADGAIRRSDDRLRGVVQGEEPRQARDVTAQAVVRGRVPASYVAGLLALREGGILAAAIEALPVRPDLVFVDATGLDHPRRAGLAVHLGARLDMPTIGVTHRPLVASGMPAAVERGQRAPLRLDGDIVAFWVCTRTGVRPVVAHAGWHTDPATAADLVLLASTEGARTPVPLQEARRVAREARTLADV
jgi:deoxyribonuclease V